ncbi:MAG: hypothetical protein IKQ04_04305 [Oscillospiraceae bacterium]|nr:hypothetical protein [Oscillospiraceae bacterium]
MPYDELRTLSAKLKEANNLRYAAFLTAVDEAAAEMKRMNTQDAFGRLPLLKKEDRQKLLDLLQAIGNAAQALNQEENALELEGQQENARQLAEKISALAAADHKALLAYDPAEPKSLPTLLEEMRTLTVDARGSVLGTAMTNMQNQRQPLTFLDDKGREITGVFTPKTVINVWGSIQEELNRIAGEIKNPEGAEMVRDLLTQYYDNSTVLDQEKLSVAERPAMLRRILDMTLNDEECGLSEQKMRGVISQLYSAKLNGRRVSRLIPSKAVRKICSAIWKQRVNILVNSAEARIPDGSRMDNRNAAMSTVADLLGIRQTVPRARPMKLIRPDGTEVEGTFMAEAKGLDPLNLSKEADGIDYKALFGDDWDQKADIGEAMHQLADLQVLDYICGNVDRHDKNLFYQFNRDKKICGVQAIDNDSGFGLLTLKGGEGRKELVGTDRMMAISRPMHRRLSQLSAASLRFALQGYGLSEGELDAACQRLEHLKSRLVKLETFLNGEKFEKGKILIVPDEKWQLVGCLRLNAQNADQSPANLFSQAMAAVSNMTKDYRAQTKQYRSLKAAVAIGSGDRTRPQNQAAEADKADALVSAVSAKAGRKKPDPNYETLLTAVKRYRDSQRELANRLRESREDLEREKTELNHKADPDAAYNAVVTTGDLLELQRLAEGITAAAQAYLAGNDKNKARATAAKLALELGQKGSVYSQEELDAAERNERQALEENNRRFGDRLEASGRTAENANLVEEETAAMNLKKNQEQFGRALAQGRPAAATEEEKSEPQLI